MRVDQGTLPCVSDVRATGVFAVAEKPKPQSEEPQKPQVPVTKPVKPDDYVKKPMDPPIKK